ncbi:TPA: hypothetical protein KUN31_003404 [Enterobacter cloacae]|nr:hypothetical protein [Enterobacter cloacae]
MTNSTKFCFSRLMTGN